MAPKDAQKAYEKGRKRRAKRSGKRPSNYFPKRSKFIPNTPPPGVTWAASSSAITTADPGATLLRAGHRGRPQVCQSLPRHGRVGPLAKALAGAGHSDGQFLALNPVDFPDAWLRNALGNYYLQNLNEAEKSARQGMKVDDQHQVPKLEYLLGVILLKSATTTKPPATSRTISRSLLSRLT